MTADPLLKHSPLMSMISHICHESPSLEVSLLYSTKVPSNNPAPSEVLFLPEILDLFRARRTAFLELFFTGTWDGTTLSHEDDFIQSLIVQPEQERRNYVPTVVWTSRIQKPTLYGAVGPPHERASSVFYVCGPPEMTDSIVQQLRETDGVASEHVLCEKWW
jgi:ferredoxin-NADP reductase